MGFQENRGEKHIKQTTGFEIKAEERQSRGSITMVWIGAMICVPALMIGSMIGAGLSLGSAALAIVIGYVLICVFMSFMSMHACDTGLPTTVMAGGALAGYQPAAPMSLVNGISLTVGAFVVAAAISGDYCRFAKNRKDVVKSSVLDVLPAGLVVLMLGGSLDSCQSYR